MQVIILLAGIANALMGYRKIEHVLQSHRRRTMAPAIWSIDKKTRRRKNYKNQMEKLIKESKKNWFWLNKFEMKFW